jgi:hypothetical protein
MLTNNLLLARITNAGPAANRILLHYQCIGPGDVLLLKQAFDDELGRCTCAKRRPAGHGSLICHRSVSCVLRYRHQTLQAPSGFAALKFQQRKQWILRRELLCSLSFQAS